MRAEKAALGRLVTIEVGKVESEGLGEVQEMIDICDFAVGLSRQLYGLTIQSERADHKLTEAWRPAGVVGVISAFNFPVAVWSWNAALALVCGDAVVWKPSEKAPLSALATEALYRRAAAKFGPDAPDGLVALLIGGRELGEALVDDPRVPVLSATGSTRMGRMVGERLARRFARAILELGGNNASIVTPSADLDHDASRRRLWRDGHGGAALHDDAPPDRPRERLRRAGRPSSPASTATSRSAIRRPRTRWSDR